MAVGSVHLSWLQPEEWGICKPKSPQSLCMERETLYHGLYNLLQRQRGKQYVSRHHHIVLWFKPDKPETLGYCHYFPQQGFFYWLMPLVKPSQEFPGAMLPSTGLLAPWLSSPSVTASMPACLGTRQALMKWMHIWEIKVWLLAGHFWKVLGWVWGLEDRNNDGVDGSFRCWLPAPPALDYVASPSPIILPHSSLGFWG